MLGSVPNHRKLKRAFASAHGTVLTVPARNSLRRLRTSSRHACKIDESSLPSRLSRSATTIADRSSVGSPSASSKTWSTRAFMRQSLAPDHRPVHRPDPGVLPPPRSSPHPQSQSQAGGCFLPNIRMGTIGPSRARNGDKSDRSHGTAVPCRIQGSERMAFYSADSLQPVAAAVGPAQPPPQPMQPIQPQPEPPGPLPTPSPVT